MGHVDQLESAGGRSSDDGKRAGLAGIAMSRVRAWEHLRGVTLWQWGLVAVVATYTVYMSWKTLAIHRGLGTSAFDLPLYDQGLWLLSRFKEPFVTIMGRNLFGDHTSFILLFLVPFYWFIGGPGFLLAVQSAAIGAGAIPIFLYARKRLENEGFALILAIVYLLHPAVVYTNMENFHPDAFLGVTVGFAIYAALSERWRMYAVFVVLALLVKEDVSLVIIPLGLWVGLRKNFRAGVLTVLGSVGYMAVATFGVMRSLTGVPTLNTWRIPFGGIRGLLNEMLRFPGNVIDHLLSDGRPWYLFQMTAPFGWLFLRVPDLALVGAVVLGTNLVSTFGYQHQIQFHYGLIAVPALAFATVHAVGRFGKKARPLIIYGLLLVSMWTALLWGPWPFSRAPYSHWAPSHPVAVAARDIVKDIPDRAAVSADHSIVPHIAHREQIYHFPTPFYAVLYGLGTSLEGTRLPEADQVEYVVLNVVREQLTQERWGLAKDEFVLVQANEHWELYQRLDLINDS